MEKVTINGKQERVVSHVKKENRVNKGFEYGEGKYNKIVFKVSMLASIWISVWIILS